MNNRKRIRDEIQFEEKDAKKLVFINKKKRNFKKKKKSLISFQID